MDLSKEILKYLDTSKPGFFVEAGANDGISQSNTYLLEKQFGWTGILVEPSITAYKKCCSERQKSKIYNSCLVSFDYSLPFIHGDFDGNLMSSVNGKRLKRNENESVTAVTIQKLFDINNIKQVDFFSLDTEGYELEVLKGIDFNETNIEKFIIEIYDHNREDIFNFLAKKGYNNICITNFNRKNNPDWDGTHNDYLFTKER